MIRSALLCCCLWACGTLFAQTLPVCTVTGEASDEAGAPIAYANVTLHRAADSMLVKGALSDEKGAFQIESLNPGGGRYFVRVSMLGFRALQSPDFELAADARTYALGRLRLQAGTETLSEVTVAAKIPFIERKLDRIVLNVENSIVNAGNSALEVLQRAPGVVVDPNDAISLRGKSGVIVMIDGKPTPLGGADLANMLRALPSSAIERIEIISNPSAKYDAAGNAGIIDIRMKKDKRLGTNGTLSANVGQGVYSKAGGGLNLNYRDRKWNLFGGYNYNYRKNLNDLKLLRRFYENKTETGAYDQVNYLVFPMHYQLARAGVDFSPSGNTIIGISAQASLSQFEPQGENRSAVLNGSDQQESSFRTRNHSRDRWPVYTLNGNFKHTFTKNRELTADLDYARYWNKTTQTFTTDYFDLSGTPFLPTYVLYGDLAGLIQIRSLKVDFVNPLPDNAKWEAGIKSSIVTADNNVQFFDKSSGTPVYDSSKSNHFIYRENINAAYLNASKEWERYSLQLGFRAEQTRANGRQLVTGQSFDTTYLNLFPSAFFNYKVSKNYETGLNLSRRLDRPGYQQLNPFKFFLDPSTYKEGNPYLRPQYSWSFEWSHTWKQKYNATLGYSVTNDNITQVVAPVEGQDRITVQTDKNLARYRYFGLTLNAPVQVFKWWNSLNDFNVFYGHYEGNLANTNLSDGNVSWTLNSSNSFTLGHDWSAELSGFYQSRQVYGFMTLDPLWSLSTGLQKQIWNRRGTVKLNVSDLFWTSGPRAVTAFRDYVEHFVVRRETRVFNLSLTYRFGNNQVAPARRRAGGAEEEKRRAGAQG